MKGRNSSSSSTSSTVHFILIALVLAFGAQQMLWPEGQWKLGFYARHLPNSEWVGTVRAFGGFMALYALSSLGYRALGKLVCAVAILLTAWELATVPPFIFGGLFLVSAALDFVKG